MRSVTGESGKHCLAFNIDTAVLLQLPRRHLTFNLQLEDEICYTTLIIKNSLHSNALVLLDLISNYGTVLIYKFLKKDSYPVTFVNRLVISRFISDTTQEPGEVEEHHNDSRGRGGTQWG